jgi:hypothetical protein
MLNHLVLGQALIRTPHYEDPNKIVSAGVRAWVRRHVHGR